MTQLPPITAAEFAARLTGREYTEEITPGEERHAKACGLVVAFGASDDLLELRGAVNEEFGAWGGTRRTIGPKGGKVTITAKWAPKKPECSWLIVPNVPFSTFDIMEDGELFCRGAVFALPAKEEVSL